MNYEETLEYLFNSTPLFQHIGQGAYKEGLSNTIALDEYFDHPHQQFRTIHVGGTNGKGSCSHTLAAILQSAGYKVGLFTSPHLVDFRERIRVNGEPITKKHVIDFVEKHRNFFEPLHPSFFELTTAMAFDYFRFQQVSVAVIEVGLGGRLDCTNIIEPDLSVITNISFDHVQLLGNTLQKIAYEKAGIIKSGIPAVIGEAVPETRLVFEEQAHKMDAPIYFAEDDPIIINSELTTDGGREYSTNRYGKLYGKLGGLCQEKNTQTILTALPLLKKAGYNFKEEDVRKGFAEVCSLTGLMGRWQKLNEHPLTICDTGHNTGGMTYIVEQLKHTKHDQLHMVIGMVNDKDVSGVLQLLPKDAIYYFTQASVKRALPAEELKELAEHFDLKGQSYKEVKQAIDAAKRNASSNDLIFIGGSNFIIADLLKK